MTAEKFRGYRFVTEAQWNACLFAQTERRTEESKFVLRPLPPYSLQPTRFSTPGGFAPAVTRVGEVLWRDGGGRLYRLSARDETPYSMAAPAAISTAVRLVVTARELWVVGGAPGSVLCFDLDTLTLRFTVQIADARVVDIAADGREGLFALVERTGALQCVHIDCAGTQLDTVTLDGLASAKAFVFLRRTKQFVLLAEDGSRLYWFPGAGGRATSHIVLATLRPCFAGCALGRDARGRIFIGGRDGPTFRSEPHVIVLDGDGALLQDIRLLGTAAATGLAASRDALLVTTTNGLDRYPLSSTVPDATAEVGAMLVTPMLYSPDTEDGRRWLRIEATAELPAGATIEVSYASTGDRAVRDRLQRIAGDTSLPASRRAQQLRAVADVWHESMAFHASQPPAGSSAAPLAVPLFDVRDPYVWVAIKLIAAPGAALPALWKLEVLYPGPTLMDNLPAIYRRNEGERGDFLRALVGVLESTTQALDARIAKMGSHIHPSSASTDWLDYIARWLGLPWDDALAPEQKRCIVQHAAKITAGRGTRAGLQTLLECLMPGTERRYRIVDIAADYGLATLGGADCLGSALPSVLTGAPSTAVELGVSAILGRARLPSPDCEEEDAWPFIGHVRVDVIATAEQRQAWAPWLAALIGEMVPVTVRVRLRWLSPAGAFRGELLGGVYELDAEPAPRLGTDAITGVARLPEGAQRLSDVGLDSSIRLH